MTRISIETIGHELARLIEELRPGEEDESVEDDPHVVRITGHPHARLEPRRPGSAAGRIRVVEVSGDYLDDFRDYIPFGEGIPITSADSSFDGYPITRTW